jgi:hypothetical protein
MNKKNNPITFGIAYNLWDDTVEHIEPIVQRIRPSIDFIAVIWQKKSYHQIQSKKPLERICENLKERGLIDHHECFEPDEYFFCNGHRNELAKRNQGLRLSKERGIKYHMSADADEYFLQQDMEYICNVYRSLDLDVATCHLANYYKSFDWITFERKKNLLCIPLFYRVQEDQWFGSLQSHLYSIQGKFLDSTRKIILNHTNTEVLRYYHFQPTEILCHHGAVIRNDLESKWLSYSSGWRFGEDTVYRFLKEFADFDLLEAIKKTKIGSKLPEKKWVWHEQYDIFRVENCIERGDQSTPEFTKFLIDLSCI